MFAAVRTRAPERPSVVLSPADVRRIVREVKEPRFRVPLRLIYRCGLRLSECLDVAVRDIDRAAGRLHVRDGTGGKDRYVPVPAAWWRQHRHPTYLFPTSLVGLNYWPARRLLMCRKRFTPSGSLPTVMHSGLAPHCWASERRSSALRW